MAVELKEVKTGREFRRFALFPQSLYRDNDQWVPSLLSDELGTIRPDRNPAFEYCRARYWLAFKDGRLAGRIGAIINDRYIQKWENRYARFGWVDFVDDREVSGALFGAAEAWARDEGMTGVHGPMGFTDMDSEGLLIEGFDEMGTMMEIYNFPYYADHLEALKYEKDSDWVEYELQTPSEIPEKALRVGNLILKRYGLTLVDAKKPRELLKYASQVFDLLNEAYAHLYGTVELTRKQIDAYVKQFFGYIDPRYNKVVVDAEGKLVAFGLILPSLAAALRKTHGKLFPFGFITLLRAMKHPTRLDLGLIAVRPELQGKGIPAIIFSQVIKAAIATGVTSAETGREMESNVQVRSLWKDFDARQHKRRRVYLKQLT